MAFITFSFFDGRIAQEVMLTMAKSRSYEHLLCWKIKKRQIFGFKFLKNFNRCRVRIINFPHQTSAAFQILQSRSQRSSRASMISSVHTAINNLLWAKKKISKSIARFNAKLCNAPQFNNAIEFLEELTFNGVCNGKRVTTSTRLLIARSRHESFFTPVSVEESS